MRDFTVTSAIIIDFIAQQQFCAHPVYR